MRVFVDGKQIIEPTPSLASALAAARAVAETARRIVVDAQLDGRPIADEILAAPPTIAGDGDLHCQTADPVDLVCSTLEGVAESLNDAKAQQTEAAKLVNLGKLEDALGKLRSPLQTWETVRQAIIDGTTLLGISPDSASVTIDGGTVTVGDCVKSLTARLSEVKRSLAAKDWSALSDVLGYDLVGEADRWQALLRALATQMRGQRSAPQGSTR